MLEAIGAGRFGPIYRAREDATGLEVAIKVFDQGLSATQAERLAASLARLADAPLNHSAIIPVLTAGTERDRAWLAEPWFDAVSLTAVIQGVGRLPVTEALVRVTQVAGALDFAAAVGIHHGALHPDDVMVNQEVTAVTGLGVLQALSDAGLSVPMEGTYVSPQRAQGDPVSASDDVYALAALTSVLVKADGPVAGVLERALSPDAAERPLTALALVAAVQEAAARTAIRESQPEIPIRAAEVPIRPFEADPEIPIRPVEAASAPLSEASLREPRGVPEPAPQEPTRIWLPLTAALAIGILGGFAGGYVVGQRDAMPLPIAAERPIARDGASSGGPRPELPAPTAGRDYTESPVTPPEAGTGSTGRSADPEPPVVSPSDPSGRVTPDDGSPERERAPAQGNGSLHVDSRPRGARVFLDGRLVGTTPVVVSDVAPGEHAVRIDLAGHRRWVTTVDVTPGERHRVAASLER